MSTTSTSNLNPKLLPRPGKPSALTLGLPALSIGADAYSRISQGESVVPSLAKAAGGAILDDIVFGMLGPWGQGLAMAGTVAMVAGQLAIENGKENTQNLAKLNSGPMMRGKSVINSKNAVTMRQRGMAMINQNGETTRSVFGDEARAYFRSSL